MNFSIRGQQIEVTDALRITLIRSSADLTSTLMHPRPQMVLSHLALYEVCTW